MKATRNRRWIWFFLVLTVLSGLGVGIQIWFNLSQQLDRDKLERARALWARNRPADYDLDLTITRTAKQPESYRLNVRDNEPGTVEVNGQPLEPSLYPLYDLPGLFEALADSGPRTGSRTLDYTASTSKVRFLQVRVRGGKVADAYWKDVPGSVPPGAGQRLTGRRDGRPLDRRLLPTYDLNALLEAIAARLDQDLQGGGPAPYAVAAFDSADGHLLRYVHSVRRTRQRVQIDVAFRPQGK